MQRVDSLEKTLMLGGIWGSPVFLLILLLAFLQLLSSCHVGWECPLDCSFGRPHSHLEARNCWWLCHFLFINIVGDIFISHTLLLPPSIFPNIRVFSNESVLRIRWPKYWSFSFSVSLSNEYSGLISFRVYCQISLQSKGLWRVLSNTTVQSINSSALSFFYSPTLTSIHDHRKNHSLD